ncbi:MAG: hypothetical protein MI864_09490, partial [Pseudomonadales bacterium]|nr:hypothetical protein [Pseudomonadales bacterium]
LNDRSQKVAQFAAQLLSRLGDDTVLEALQAEADLARELADGYELVNRGVLKKRSHLKPRKLKNKTQRAIRSEQLAKISLVSLASALGLSIAELVTSWHLPDNSAHDNRVFMQKAVSGLAEDQLDALLDNLLNSAEEQTDFIGLLQLLLPRLPNEKRAPLCLELLQAPSTKLDFQDCLAFLVGPLSALDWNAMEKTTPWRNIVKQVKLDLEGAAYIDNTQLSYEFQALGLILPRKTAEAALETVTALGIRPSDPILDALRLNSRLKPSHSPE